MSFGERKWPLALVDAYSKVPETQDLLLMQKSTCLGCFEASPERSGAVEDGMSEYEEDLCSMLLPQGCSAPVHSRTSAQEGLELYVSWKFGEGGYALEWIG